jgi:integrase
MGSLYRKSDKKNTWVYQYSVNGKRKYKVISNIGDLDKKQKRELLTHYDKTYEGVFNHYGKKLPSLKKVIDDLIDERTRMVSLQTLSHNTLEGDISRLNLFWEFLKNNFKRKDLDVTSFDTELLNQYMEYCRIDRGNNSTTISNNMNVLRNLSNLLVDKSYIVENPFTKLKIPKPRKRGSDDIPHKDDYDKIKDYLEYWVEGYLNDEYEFELINTLIYIQTKTGMRGGEVKMMKWEKGDDDIGHNHSYSYVYISKDFKKIVIHFKRRLREIPINPKLVKLLKKVKTNTDSKVYVLEGHNKTTKSFDKRFIGKKLDDSYGRVRNGKGRIPPIVKLWNSIGITKYYTPHEIRHGFVSDLVRKDKPFKKIGDFVGHGYQTMTELYTHLRSQDLEDISLSV